jgi:1,4-alpha-glucan branching enzyme
MGNEFAQRDEWNHDQSLDWHLLDAPAHRGVQHLVRDLNRLYRSTPALFERDFEANGFAWLDWEDRENSVLSWLRFDHHGGFVICIINLTPMVRNNYRVGVPAAGQYQELVNTDDELYDGSGTGNGVVSSERIGHKGYAESISLTLPPLATLFIGRA